MLAFLCISSVAAAAAAAALLVCRFAELAVGRSAAMLLDRADWMAVDTPTMAATAKMLRRAARMCPWSKVGGDARRDVFALVSVDGPSTANPT